MSTAAPAVLRRLRSRGASCLKECSLRPRCGRGLGGRARCCAGAGNRTAERLLPHISCLLALFSGAGLATCARLKWDPSAYVALRELFPLEYRVACVALPLGCAAAVALNHLAIYTLLVQDLAQRRILLLVYAALTLALAVAEVGCTGWLAIRLARWLRSADARRVLAAIDFKDYFVGPALVFLGRFLSISRKAKTLMDEVDADVPYNLYCACGAGAVLLLLQLLAAVLALLAAPSARYSPSCDCLHVQQRLHNGGSHRGSTYVDMPPLGDGATRGGRSRRLPLLAPVM